MGAKGDNNRQRIIEAADQLFYTRGYNQTSFRDISDMTGIPRGNFYYYFKTKDEILNAVIDHRLTGIQNYLRQCEASSANPRRRLMAFAELLDYNKRNVVEFGCPLGSLSSELAKDDEQLQRASVRVFEIIRQWLQQQFDELGFGDAEARAMDLMARMQGITVMSCAFKDIAFLERSNAAIKEWINRQTLS